MRTSILGLVLGAAILAGCAARRDASGGDGGAPSSSASTQPSAGSGLVSVDAAVLVALAHSASLTPPIVRAKRLSTFGAEMSGSEVAPADTQVWAVTFSGTFPPVVRSGHGDAASVPVTGDDRARPHRRPHGRLDRLRTARTVPVLRR